MALAWVAVHAWFAIAKTLGYKLEEHYVGFTDRSTHLPYDQVPSHKKLRNLPSPGSLFLTISVNMHLVESLQVMGM